MSGTWSILSKYLTQSVVINPLIWTTHCVFWALVRHLIKLHSRWARRLSQLLCLILLRLSSLACSLSLAVDVQPSTVQLVASSVYSSLPVAYGKLFSYSVKPVTLTINTDHQFITLLGSKWKKKSTTPPPQGAEFFNNSEHSNAIPHSHHFG